MSLVLRIDELIDTLFEHPSFQSKLRSFCEPDHADLSATREWKSVRTDISDRAQDSCAKGSLQVETVTLEIEELLSEVYNKSTHQKLEAIEMCRIFQDIEIMKQQIQRVKAHCDMLTDKLGQLIEKQKQKTDTNIIQKFGKWETQMLEKVDIVNKRNFKKVQSIFADKLNSFQMSIQNKFDNLKQPNLQRKHVKTASPSIQAEQPEESAKKSNKNSQQVQAQLMKKLKSAKSLGSLFGFKS